MNIRRLRLPDLYNARDLGGYPTRDGRATRFGVYVRSDAPVGLAQESIEYLTDYGIRTSLDLRSAGETIARPSALKDVTAYNHMSLFDRMAQGEVHMPKHEQMDWGRQYIDMAEHAREWAVNVLTLSADCDGALLYHCTTGKDRTGLMSCYLLSIAGVDRADIAADYCVSEIYLKPVFDRIISGELRLGPPSKKGAPDMQSQLPKAPDDGFFRTPASAMLTLIDYLNAEYGSVTDYLRHIGVGDDVMERIRAKFVCY